MSELNEGDAMPAFDLAWVEIRSPGTGVTGYLMDVDWRAKPMNLNPGDDIDLRELQDRPCLLRPYDDTDYSITCGLAPQIACETCCVVSIYRIEHGPERPAS